MKDIIWLGNTHQIIKDFAPDAKQEIGYNLDKVQRGLEPSDWKPITSVGPGVKEIRIHLENEYRVLYVAKFQEAIYILPTFTKKTQQTLQKDIDLSKQRYKDLLKMRKD